MSFTINFMRNNSEVTKVGKSLQGLFDLTGTLKNECSIVNPVILVEKNEPITANYARIEAFGRYYFITDVVSIRNNLWEVHMKCDVLESFKEEIKGNTCILKRQSRLFNLYLPDDKLVPHANRFQSYKMFPQNPFNGGTYIGVLGSIGYQSKEV